MLAKVVERQGGREILAGAAFAEGAAAGSIFTEHALKIRIRQMAVVARTE